MTDLWSKTELKLYALRKSRDGIIVSFVLHPDDVSKALMNAPIGARFLAAMVEIVDDQEPHAMPGEMMPVNSSVEERKEPGLSRVAGIHCNDPDFRKFLVNYFEDISDEERTPEWAAKHVREFCGVESRRELDTDKEAASAFRTLLDQFGMWERRIKDY
jgi:hypothetical protein